LFLLIKLTMQLLVIWVPFALLENSKTSKKLWSSKQFYMHETGLLEIVEL